MAGGSNFIVKVILRFLLKFSWSQGSKKLQGVPRLTRTEIQRLLPTLRAGDCLLIGGATSLSHVSVYVGEGFIIHSVATEKTSRGKIGSLIDATIRPFRWLIGWNDFAGVIEETLEDFVERFDRHSYVSLRWQSLDTHDIQRGIQHIRALVGKPYDYDFNAGDDEYYCSEIAMEFLEEAAGHLPALETRTVNIPLILNTEVVDPDALLKSNELEPIICNQAALTHYPELLVGVPLLS